MIYLQTPDSGISTGTTLTPTVSSNALSADCPCVDDACCLRHRNHGRNSYGILDEGDQSDGLLHPRDNRRSGTFTSSAASDQGFVSGHFHSRDRLSRYLSDQESVSAHSLPVQTSQSGGSFGRHNISHSMGEVHTDLAQGNQLFSPIPCTNNRLPLVEESQTNYANFSGAYRSTSTPQGAALRGDQPFLRRNNYSHASNLSASTEYSMRESSYSADYTDQSDCMSCLQPSDMFDQESQISTSNMEQLHQEIRIIRDEISEMNDRVQVLSSRETLEQLFMLTPNPMKDLDMGAPPLRIRRHKRPLTRERHHSGESRSCSVSVDGDGADPANWRRSYHHTGEYIWDYQSDLAAEDSRNFVAQRPLVGESAAEIGDRIDYDSPTFDHVRKYIESCCNANITPDVTPVIENRSAPKSRTFNSITDMYIDDSLSELGGFSMDGNCEERNIPDGCYSNANTTATSIELYNDALKKQLSFNQDCDNNGNHGDVSLTTSSHSNHSCTVDPNHETCVEHSLCLECGSPDHRKRCRDVSAVQFDNSLSTGRYNGGGSDGSKTSGSLQSVDSGSNCGHNAIQDGDLQATIQRNKRRKWQVMNISKKINIFEFAEKKLKGDSPESQIRKNVSKSLIFYLICCLFRFSRYLSADLFSCDKTTTCSSIT
jgi:hypothetical protein